MAGRKEPKNHSGDQPEMILARFYKRNGFLRLPNPKRKEQLGSRKYKKGYEVRLVANHTGELEQMQQALEQVGFKPGKPYQKSSQMVQPIYGKEAVLWFMMLDGEERKF